VLDAQDTWVELEVRDAHGKRLAEAGEAQQATGVDETAHRLRAVQGDEHGTPLLQRETQRFRAPVFNHTIAPRDAEVVRFRCEVPASLTASQLPLHVTARLRHRSRDLALARAACADAKTSRGAAFAREVTRRTGGPMDPCVAEPVTEVATSEVELGAGAAVRPGAMPTWRRLYDHGLGMLHALQEDVESARPSLERALEVLPLGAAREQAMVLDALAEVSIREGRTDEALRRLDAAEVLVPDHPAIPHARGAALGRKRPSRCARPRSRRPSTTASGPIWPWRTAAPTIRAPPSTRRPTASPSPRATPTCCACRRWRWSDSVRPPRT
jgi:tetratricopeptide (TPR) repeat protein